jgi:hypothetical protein
MQQVQCTFLKNDAPGLSNDPLEFSKPTTIFTKSVSSWTSKDSKIGMGPKRVPTGLTENCENQSKIGLNLNFKFDFDEHR